MLATQAHLEGNKRYQDTLDRIVFYVPKGEKVLIKTFAESQGLSLNAYINKLVEEDMGK